MADTIEHDLSPQSDTFIIYKGPLSPGKFSPLKYRDTDRDPEHIELLKTTRLELSPGSPIEVHLSNDVQASSNALTIIPLTCTALIPALLGAAFYASLGLSSLNAEFYPNQTFVRPIDDGFKVAGVLLSPLLISSISSTIIGDIGVWSTSLLAFHLAYRWLKASRSRPNSLPSPFQYFLMCQMVTQASLMSFVSALKYLVLRNPTPSRTTPSSRIRRLRDPITGLLLAAVSGLACVLALSLGIKGLDIFLHDGIVSTVIARNSSILINGRTSVSTGCEELSITGCPVLPRSTQASIGGRNASTNLAVYEAPYNPTSLSLAYLGPMLSEPSVKAVNPTIVVASSCSVSSIVCSFGTKPAFWCASNDSIRAIRFDTDDWGSRLQVLLASDHNLTGVTEAGWSFGTARNPFNIVGFATFINLENVAYSKGSYIPNPEHPYISWWTASYEDGQPPEPDTLAFAFDCEVSVFDASYAVSNGNVRLEEDTLSLANASTTVAISASLLWMNNIPLRSNSTRTGNVSADFGHFETTQGYGYTSLYLDEQLQGDITLSANTYGNDTTRFAAAIAQSLSNRLAGWSAGAITMETMEANYTQSILALRIPLVLSWTYIGLHVTYALVILLLGVSCLLLPTAAPSGSLGPLKRVHKRKLSDEDGCIDDPTIALTSSDSISRGADQDLPRASDLAAAQLKLSDASTLVYEFVQRDVLDLRPEQHIVRLDSHRQSFSRATSSRASASLDLGLGSVPSLANSVGTGSTGVVSRRRFMSADEQNSVRLAVRPDVDGTLRLQTM